MNARIINLKSRRKQKARADKAAQASANAAKFGRTKAQKQQEQASDDQVVRHLDGHRLDRAPGDDDR
ncbi:MAG: DUF4169 family protein [Pseudomonadota bacterium]